VDFTAFAPENRAVKEMVSDAFDGSEAPHFTANLCTGRVPEAALPATYPESLVRAAFSGETLPAGSVGTVGWLSREKLVNQGQHEGNVTAPSEAGLEVIPVQMSWPLR
jgi:hypothetical protein